MIEVPCILRCDRCNETTSVTAETEDVQINGTRVFVITPKMMPMGWGFRYGVLQCPRCNGAK